MPPPADLLSFDRREAALGAFAVGLGVAVALGARGFEGGSAYDVLGPRLLPFIIAAGLILSGLPILIGAWRRAPAGAREELDPGPVLLIVVALVVPILLIRTLGWIPVAGLTFALGARAFTSRTPVRDLALGLAFGAVSFVAFNYGLGLNLPSGRLLAPFLGG